MENFDTGFKKIPLNKNEVTLLKDMLDNNYELLTANEIIDLANNTTPLKTFNRCNTENLKQFVYDSITRSNKYIFFKYNKTPYLMDSCCAQMDKKGCYNIDLDVSDKFMNMYKLFVKLTNGYENY